MFNCFYYRRLLEQGVMRPVPIDFTKTPHCLLVGASGTGKTTALKLLLGKISLFESQAKAVICDFKGDEDFSFLKSKSRFYRYEEVCRALTAFLRCSASGKAEKPQTEPLAIL